MKNLTWQNPEQLFVAQELINKVKSKCCGIKAYVKKHPSIAELMQDAETSSPYNGAKEHYILDVEHTEDLLKVVGTLEQALPFPKEKKKSASKK